MILIWIVKCDECGRIINAKKEEFNIRDNEQHLCSKCNEEV